MNNMPVSIVNMALARLGQAAISSMDEGSASSNAASLVYDTCRRTVLQSYPWSFASRIASLALLAEKPVDYKFAYQLPNDCLNVIRLNSTRHFEGPEGHGRLDEAGAYVVRGNVLYTDSPSAIIEYVADVEDVTKFEPRFTEALVIRLASELAMPVGAKGELMIRFREEYEGIVRQAASRSAGQFYEESDDNPYLHARW